MSGIFAALGIIVAVLTIVTLLYVIRDRRAIYYKGEFETERARADGLQAAVNELSASRSLTPVLEQLAKNATLQQQTLDKMIAINGSLGHMRDGLKDVQEGLATTVEALKLVAGMVVGASDLPARPLPHRRSRAAT